MMCSPFPGSMEMPDLPDHFPIDVNEWGEGPVFGFDAHETVCWCRTPGCLLRMAPEREQ